MKWQAIALVNQGDRQHSFVPCLDGPERASAGLFLAVLWAVIFVDEQPEFDALFKARVQARAWSSEGCSSALKVGTHAGRVRLAPLVCMRRVFCLHVYALSMGCGTDVQRLRDCGRRPSAATSFQELSPMVCTRLVHGWLVAALRD